MNIDDDMMEEMFDNLDELDLDDLTELDDIDDEIGDDLDLMDE